MVMYEIVDEHNDSFEYEDSARVAYFIKIIVLQKIMHVTSKDSSYCDDWPVIIDMICITVVIATRSSNHVLMIMIIMWWQWWQLPSKFSAEKNKIKMACCERRSAPQLSLTKSDHYHLCPPRWKFAGRPSWQCDDDKNLACVVAWHLHKVESGVAVAPNVAHVHRVRDVVAQQGSLQRRRHADDHQIFARNMKMSNLAIRWRNLPVDIGVAEIIGSLLSKVDTATSDQFEPIVNLQSGLNLTKSQIKSCFTICTVLGSCVTT